jgi:protein-tyrosine phosphatase
MAEIIAKHIFARDGIAAEISSAGIFVSDNSFINDHAIDVLKNMIDNSALIEKNLKRKARQIIIDDLIINDLILVMSSLHKKILIDRFDNFSNKIFTLPYFTCNCDLDISDPFMMDVDVYESCAKQIYKFIDLLSKKMN